MNDIQMAQVEAGERVVIERLQRKGLIAVPPRTAIVINLDDLREMIKTYINERTDDNDLLPYLLFSDFLEWLRRKQQSESDNEINARR